MSRNEHSEAKYRIEIEQAYGPVTGDNPHVEQHFHAAPPPAPPASRDELLAAIHQASADLRTYATDIAGVHIERAEVTQIVEWVQTADPPKRLGMLLDQPGGGKTVVMHDVLVALESARVPTLAIKADMLSGIRTRGELADRLSLPAPVEECVRALAAEHDLVVVILDQLDALSLALSRDQATLYVMLSTLTRLRNVERVRIVASCRTFDLNNDPRLSTVKVDHRFQLRPLDAQQIKLVLQPIGVVYERLLPAHQQLLSIPLHLEVYTRIAVSSPDNKPGESYRTLQDLYEALWQRQIVVSPPETPRPAERITAVYQLVDTMQRQRQLTAAIATLDAYLEAAVYLERVGFIRREERNWLFAHQTLFDYCYARRFVAQGRSLTDEMRASSQGLFERSQMVQVLAYLRGTDEAQYGREVRKLLFSDRLRVHLRLLLFGWFGSLYRPTDDEFQIAQRLLQDKQDRLLFLQAATGNGSWFDRLQERVLPTILASEDEPFIEAVVYYLSTLIESRTKAVLALFDPYLERSEVWDNRIGYCLTSLRDWRSDEAILVLQNLFRRGGALERSDLYLHFLAESNPAGGCQVLRIYLEQRLDALLAKRQAEMEAAANDPQAAYRVDAPSRFLEDQELLGRYGVSDVMERAIKDCPKAVIEHILPWFVQATVALGTSYPEDSYPFEPVFSMHWYGDHILEGPTFARHVAQALQHLAKTDPSAFRAIASRLAEIEALAVQRVLIEAYLSDPQTYADDIFDYLTGDARHLHVGEFMENSHYDSQRLYAAVFPHLDAASRIILEQVVLDLRLEWEWRNLQHRGLTQLRFLQAVPRDLLSEPTRLKLMELERKFPGVHTHIPQGAIGGVVGPPISADAQKKMADDAWLGAMRKYDDSTTWRAPGRNPLKGGVIELSRAFAEQTKKEPERFYRLTQRFDERISLHYIEAAISGLAEAQAPAERVFELVRQFASRLEGESRRQVCWSLEKRAEAGVPDDLLDMLADWALHDPDPQEESWQIPAWDGQPYHRGDPYSHGINTNRGAAIIAFCRCTLSRQPAQIERTFQLLEQATNDPFTAVRTCVVECLRMMLNHDAGRVVHLLEGTLEGHPRLLQVPLVHDLLYWVLQEHFLRIRPTIEALMSNDEEATRQAGARLACLAAFRRPEATSLAEQVLWGDAAMRRGAAEIYARNLELPHLRETCQERLLLLMQDEDEQVQAHVGRSFEYLAAEHVAPLRSFILEFLDSPSLIAGVRYLLKFLKLIVVDEPEFALHAVGRVLEIVGNELVNIRSGMAILEDDVVHLLLAIYNHSAESTLQSQAIDRFERLLLLGGRQARQALADWDRR